MKKTWSILLTLAMGISLAGCSSAGSGAKERGNAGI